VAAFLFAQFGTAKLIAFPAAIMPGGGTAALGSLPGIAGLLESVGGALLLVGLFTRPVAFVLAGEMAVAYFIGHAPHGFWPILNQGHPAILFCFVWLYISAAGVGTVEPGREAGETAFVKRMPWPGFEPGCLAALPPQDSVSTSFTTRAGLKS